MSIIKKLFGRKEKISKSVAPPEEKISKSVDLSYLPADIDIKKFEKCNLIYNSIEKQLSFSGEMSDSDRKYFSNLSDNKPYKRAIRSLFLKNQGGKDILLAFMSLKAGINDKDFAYSIDKISHLIKGNGESYVDFISDALWTIPNTRNSALKILHLISSSSDMFPEAAEYAKNELADWEEEQTPIIVTVTQQEGFIEIKCPECGNHFQSLLLANDPAIETKSWGADCPNCNNAFYFKVFKKT